MLIGTISAKYAGLKRKVNFESQKKTCSTFLEYLVAFAYFHYYAVFIFSRRMHCTGPRLRGGYAQSQLERIFLKFSYSAMSHLQLYPGLPPFRHLVGMVWRDNASRVRLCSTKCDDPCLGSGNPRFLSRDSHCQQYRLLAGFDRRRSVVRGHRGRRSFVS